MKSKKATSSLNLAYPVNPVWDQLQTDRQECLFYFQSFPHSLKHPIDLDVHANPIRTGTSMAVSAAVNIDPFHTNVPRP
jgi:hypothetical protein